MSMQSLVFAVGSVVENAFEKNREIWLVFLWCIKMCEKFIKFFGNIHEDRINRVITDFGLSDGYKVHDGLDQGEVRRHEQLCEYCIDSKFVAKIGRVESISEITSYFVTGIFVDNTIWVGNCQASTQYALNIASEFFKINDISINNNKTVTILINQSVKVASLNICGQPISIAKKGKVHHYLEIFLSMERLSKPSVAKAHSDICFFVNVMLRKAIIDKKYSYLVSAILQSIISYRTQFSYVLFGICRNWNVIVRKGLKFKAGLLCDFSNAALYHPFLYGLKTFEQVQSEGKSDVFSAVKDGLHDVWSDCFEVYTNRSLKEAGFADVTCGVAVYFLALDLSVGIAVHDLEVVWVKIKEHSGISNNVKTDLAAEEAIWSPFILLAEIHEWFLVAENTAVSDNAHHFVRNIFQSVSHAYWEARPGYGVVFDELVGGVDWISTVKDHAFTCVQDVAVRNEVLAKASVYWISVAGVCVLLSSTILWALFVCFLDVSLYFVVYKGFVLSK
ncbi:hypothetical protein G9A89_013822 [Geosiphon pyriformis]|nr:hypothetical protein G9A89_013822 [Geosiphon pyriformis]